MIWRCTGQDSAVSAKDISEIFCFLLNSSIDSLETYLLLLLFAFLGSDN